MQSKLESVTSVYIKEALTYVVSEVVDELVGADSVCDVLLQKACSWLEGRSGISFLFSYEQADAAHDQVIELSAITDASVDPTGELEIEWRQL